MTSKLRRNDIAFFIIFIMLIMGSTVQSVCAQAREVRENTLRLHMLANSNSDFDQRLKLELRDELLQNYSEALSSSDGIDQAISKTSDSLNEIEDFLESKVKEKGFDYNVKANIVVMYFDTRVYSESITMPAGYYNALRITIGEGKGENWWCVMYPPLCIPVATQGQAKTVEEKIAQLNQGSKFVPKFAVVEIIENISQGK